LLIFQELITLINSLQPMLITGSIDQINQIILKCYEPSWMSVANKLFLSMNYF